MGALKGLLSKADTRSLDESSVDPKPVPCPSKRQLDKDAKIRKPKSPPLIITSTKGE